MSVARFIADQRTKYQVPHTLVCALLGVRLAWFYKWIARADGPDAVSEEEAADWCRRQTLTELRAVGVLADGAEAWRIGGTSSTCAPPTPWTVGDAPLAGGVRSPRDQPASLTSLCGGGGKAAPRAW